MDGQKSAGTERVEKRCNNCRFAVPARLPGIECRAIPPIMPGQPGHSGYAAWPIIQYPHLDACGHWDADVDAAGRPVGI